MKTRIVTTIVVATAGLVAATSAWSSSPRSLVAAFYPVASAAQEIGGPTVRVQNLTPAGPSHMISS
jgi:ABC-type Zn uptake system ZnuABC Zn-binding protein ZnuA